MAAFETRWRVRPEAIVRAVQTKSDTSVPTLMILNHPGNPDGLAYTDDELRALSEALAQHDILVVSDEIYGLLNHTGAHVAWRATTRRPAS